MLEQYFSNDKQFLTLFSQLGWMAESNIWQNGMHGSLLGENFNHLEIGWFKFALKYSPR